MEKTQNTKNPIMVKQIKKYKLIGRLSLILGILTTPLVITPIVGIATFVFSSWEIKKIKRSFCPYCGKKYDYDTEIEWEVADITEKDTSHVAAVDFTCHCGDCGQDHEFTAKFTVASVDKEGRVKQHNINNSIRKYFKSVKGK